MDDPYQVLGVSPDASVEQVRAAYVAAMRRVHPDVGEGDEEAAKRLTVAYTILADGSRRVDRTPGDGEGGATLPATIDPDRPEPVEASCELCGPEPDVGFTVPLDDGHLAFRHALTLNAEVCESCSQRAARDLESRGLAQGPGAITGIFAALGYTIGKRAG